MTRLPRRTSLFLSFSLLTIATSAHAERSWVLWTYTLDKGARLEDYSVDEAHSTQRECEQSVRGYAGSLKAKAYTVSGGYPDSKTVIGTQAGTTFKYFCLPDTVDPRGPKGK